MEWNKDCFFVGFEFKDVVICARMVERGPWCLNDGVILLERWPQPENWKDCKFSSMSLWVRVQDQRRMCSGLQNLVESFIASNGTRILQRCSETILDVEWR